MDIPILDMNAMPKVTPVPGTFTAVFDPPRLKTAGGILLGEKEGRRGFAQDHRPDCVTVLTAASDVPLATGDRLMVAPYSTNRFESYQGVPDWCVVGMEDDWIDVCPLIWNPADQMWEPVDNWCAVIVQPKEIGLLTKRTYYENWGLVLQSGPTATVQAGQKVALHKDRIQARPNDTKWFIQDWGYYPKQTVFVREVDSEGFRRILGVIED